MNGQINTIKNKMDEEKKEIYRKESDIVKEVLEKVMSFTAEDEVGLKYLIRNLAREYGVELSGKLNKMRAVLK